MKLRSTTNEATRACSTCSTLKRLTPDTSEKITPDQQHLPFVSHCRLAAYTEGLATPSPDYSSYSFSVSLTVILSPEHTRNATSRFSLPSHGGLLANISYRTTPKEKASDASE